MPRVITTDDEIAVLCSDNKDEQGLSSNYWVKARQDGRMLGNITFQQGPVKVQGINGLQIEDLLNICIDRLERLQAGKFSCRENAVAITKLEEAMHWLNHRTADRKKRGVEGYNAA